MRLKAGPVDIATREVDCGIRRKKLLTWVHQVNLRDRVWKSNEQGDRLLDLGSPGQTELESRKKKRRDGHECLT